MPVVASREKLVAWFVALTVTSGRTAPLGSVAFPTRLPVVCADAAETSNSTTTATAHCAASCEHALTQWVGRRTGIFGIFCALLCSLSRPHAEKCRPPL